MADKIDQLKIGSTSYDIDLPPDASPSIASLTVSGTTDVSAGTLKLKTVNAPTSSGGSTYGPGTNGYVLTSNGTSSYWAPANAGPSTYLKSASTSSNTLTLTKQDNTTVTYTPSFTDTNYYPIRSYTSGLQISSYNGSTNCQLYVPDATTTQSGVITTGSQTFAGQKTFNNNVTINGLLYVNHQDGTPVHLDYVAQDNPFLQVDGSDIKQIGNFWLTGLTDDRSYTFPDADGLVVLDSTYGKYNKGGSIKPAYSTTGTATLTTSSQGYTNSPTINARTTTAGKYYAVEIDSAGRAFVNVPWSGGSIPITDLR